MAPPNRVDVALAFAPRVTNNFATASWPATIAACNAGTSVAGAATIAVAEVTADFELIQGIGDRVIYDLPALDHDNIQVQMTQGLGQ